MEQAVHDILSAECTQGNINKALDFIFISIKDELDKKRQMTREIAELVIEPAESVSRILEDLDDKYINRKGYSRYIEAIKIFKRYLSDPCAENGNALYHSKQAIKDIEFRDHLLFVYGSLSTILSAVNAVTSLKEFDFLIKRIMNAKKKLSHEKVVLAISAVETEKALEKVQNATKDQRALLAYQSDIAVETEHLAQDAIKDSVERIDFLLKDMLLKSSEVAEYAALTAYRSAEASLILIHDRHTGSCDCQKYVDSGSEKARYRMLEKQKEIILKYFG